MNAEVNLEGQVVEVLRLLGEVRGKQGEVWRQVEGLLQRELGRLEWLLGR